MVRKAFEALTDGAYKTRLICVSDDMDGMRKVPDNLPNQEMLAGYLQKPLTAVPDPFGTHASYGAHMNARLQAFLDSFGFEYEFASATELYKSRRLRRDAAARRRKVRRHHEADAAEPRRGAPRNLFALPADLADHRSRALRADEEGRRQGRHGHLRRRERAGHDAPRHRRQCEAAMEAGLRHALGRPRRRLRNVRQGPPGQCADLFQDRPHPRRRASAPVRLRALPRRKRREDLEVERQRHLGRAVAHLRAR